MELPRDILEGVGDILTAVETLRVRLHQPVDVLGILGTRVDGRTTRMNSDIEASTHDLYGDLLLDTRIPQSSALNKAHLAGQHIFKYQARSPGALAYEALAEELCKKLELRLAKRAQNKAIQAKAVARA